MPAHPSSAATRSRACGSTKASSPAPTDRPLPHPGPCAETQPSRPALELPPASPRAVVPGSPVPETSAPNSAAPTSDCRNRLLWHALAPATHACVLSGSKGNRTADRARGITLAMEQGSGRRRSGEVQQDRPSVFLEQRATGHLFRALGLRPAQQVC